MNDVVNGQQGVFVNKPISNMGDTGCYYSSYYGDRSTYPYTPYYLLLSSSAVTSSYHQQGGFGNVHSAGFSLRCLAS